MARKGFVLLSSSSSLPRLTINDAPKIKMYSQKHSHSHTHAPPTQMNWNIQKKFSSWLHRCRCFRWPPLPSANLQFCASRKIECIFPPRQCSGCQPIAMWLAAVTAFFLFLLISPSPVSILDVHKKMHTAVTPP